MRASLFELIFKIYHNYGDIVDELSLLRPWSDLTEESSRDALLTSCYIKTFVHQFVREGFGVKLKFIVLGEVIRKIS